jgi:glycosyltransferase involved in cell wall biosynthesis
MLKRASQFILHNAHGRDPFCRRYRIPAERVSVVRLGAYDVFREWMHAVRNQDERTVLFFGRLSPYKGLEVLYQAASRVATLVPGVRFIVSGRPVPGYGPPPPPALPNGCRVDVNTGYVSNAQLAELFQRATVVVCPYLDATQSGVVLTAYAFERPVVATHVGGLPEYVGDAQTGLLVPPGNIEALALALTEVLTNATLRARLQAGIVERKRRDLAWDTVGRATFDVYQRVLRRCRSR